MAAVCAPRNGFQRMERGGRILWRIEGLIPIIDARFRVRLRFTSRVYRTKAKVVYRRLLAWPTGARES